MSEHATDGAGGYVHRTGLSPDHLHMLSIKTEHWPFCLKKKKKKKERKKRNMLVHIHQLLYVQ
ncbi:hypothetical protein ACRRTK_021528 [Alexandromys fortis]